MSEIGKRGLRATADRWFGGSVSEAMAWLRKRATEAAIDEGVIARMEAKLIAGEGVVYEELPVILGPDADPIWQDRVAAATRSRAAGPPR